MKNRIGIVGGGQLGRMMGIAAKNLGFHVTVIDPTPDSPASQVVDHQIVAHYTDEKAIRELSHTCDFITFEIELANAKLLNELTQKGAQVNPSPYTLLIIKDKFKQKEFLKKNHIPVAPFMEVTTVKDIQKAARIFNYPFLLKARMDAYDGRGNTLIKSEQDIKTALIKLQNRKLYVEKYIPFVKELAVMVARSAKGEIQPYPVVETVHKNNICHLTFVPARISESIRQKALNLAKKTVAHLKGAGVFGIEMFLTKKDEMLVNELAPRVHNSGHYTIECCTTSQFEQHIRAVTGLPLGKTNLTVPAAVMINILGTQNGAVKITGREKALALPNVHLHIYGKHETRPERKMGHITATASSVKKALELAVKARRYIKL